MENWEQLLNSYRDADAEYTASMRVISDKLDKFENGKSNDLPTADDVERSEKALKARIKIEQMLSEFKVDSYSK